MEPCVSAASGFMNGYDLYLDEGESIVFTVDIPAGVEYVR